MDGTLLSCVLCVFKLICSFLLVFSFLISVVAVWGLALKKSSRAPILSAGWNRHGHFFSTLVDFLSTNI